jgi:hypothetical protein
MANSRLSLLACVLVLIGTNALVAQTNDFALTSDAAPGTGEVPPIGINTPIPECATTSGSQLWARGEYVAWVVGTGKLVDMAKEAYNSQLFNSLLAAAGKNFKDVGQTLLGDERTGVRFTLGAWIDSDQAIGVEAGLLYFNRGSLVLSMGNNDRSPLANIIPNSDIILQRERTFDPTFQNVDHTVLVALLLNRLGVPAIDANRREVIVPIGNRDLINASMQFDIAAKTFCMFDLLGRAQLFDSDCCRVDGLLGYRHLSCSDNLGIQTQVETLAAPLLAGTQLSSVDQIRAYNYYDGALVGIDLAYNCGPWTLTARPTATIAQLNAIVRREAATFVTFPEGRFGVIQGGAFMSGATLNDLATTTCTVISELDLSAARQCGEHLRLFCGTSFIYLPQVAYAPAQLQLGIDPNRALASRPGFPQLPTPTSPELHSGFAITISAGFEIRF